jgi:hypothetical protein
LAEFDNYFFVALLVTAGGFGSNVMGFAADGAAGHFDRLRAGLPDNWIGGPFAID